jgi:hypothetical protein
VITASVPSLTELRHFFLIVNFCSLSGHMSTVEALMASVEFLTPSDVQRSDTSNSICVT